MRLFFFVVESIVLIGPHAVAANQRPAQEKLGKKKTSKTQPEPPNPLHTHTHTHTQKQTNKQTDKPTRNESGNPPELKE